ncbi:hypothetical protein [Anabaena azotica]|uniref:CpcD n=1 Tax=Anabaena azotica FACHB-119 TaxID=947527 RepID=A0ABR8DDM5_9NOST|nr:hypothetical protein [Anabaena azotica]MBD2505335.1 hypothetical protein [Anabaena azotica FACHB-119]
MSDNIKLKAVPQRYRSSRVQAYEVYGGYEIIIICYPIEPDGEKRYFFYIQDAQSEVVGDNSKGYGERCSEDALSEAKEYIDILNIPV